MFALKELQGLSSMLESRVEERTHALETMQGAMIRTERLNAMAVLGAGLASVRQLLQELKGTLAVASEEGAGTAFPLRIPLIDA